MCGRYVSVSSPEALAERFGVDDVTVEQLPRRWNVAPTLDVPAVLQRDGVRALGTLRWGFVLLWALILGWGALTLGYAVWQDVLHPLLAGPLPMLAMLSPMAGAMLAFIAGAAVIALAGYVVGAVAFGLRARRSA